LPSLIPPFISASTTSGIILNFKSGVKLISLLHFIVLNTSLGDISQDIGFV
jgi:hypothetical protein